MELEDILSLDTIRRLGTPEELEVGRQNLLGEFAVNDLVDGSRITDTGITADAQALACSLKHGKQRVQLLGLLQLCVRSGFDVFLGIAFLELELRLLLLGLLHFLLGSGFGSSNILVRLGGIGNRILLSIAVGHALVELLQIGEHLVGIVSFPELEVSRTLEELTHTLRLTDTRHLHGDTSLSALHLLDVGLYDTKLVDTRCHNIQ